MNDSERILRTWDGYAQCGLPLNDAIVRFGLDLIQQERSAGDKCGCGHPERMHSLGLSCRCVGEGCSCNSFQAARAND